jgi:hypothetical protein
VIVLRRTPATGPLRFLTLHVRNWIDLLPRTDGGCRSGTFVSAGDQTAAIG